MCSFVWTTDQMQETRFGLLPLWEYFERQCLKHSLVGCRGGEPGKPMVTAWKRHIYIMQTGFSLANQKITLSGSYIQWLFASQRQLCHEKHLTGKEKKVQFWLGHWVWARDARSVEFGMRSCFHWSWRRGSHFQCCLPKPLGPALCSASMSISGKARRVPCPGIRSLKLLVAEESHPGAYLPPPHYLNETQGSTASSVVVFFRKLEMVV